MNIKNNSRRKESIRRIETAFVELLQTRELKDISVSDICKICKLNRSTFYANYEDIYQLADKIKSELEQQVFDLYSKEWGKTTHSYDYLPLFYHMRENQIFYKTYFKLGYDNDHPIKLYDMQRAEDDFQDQYMEYHIEFFRSGFNAIVKKWLAEGCVESPEVMVQIIKSEYQGR